jgi:hypothetical protein
MNLLFIFCRRFLLYLILIISYWPLNSLLLLSLWRKLFNVFGLFILSHLRWSSWPIININILRRNEHILRFYLLKLIDFGGWTLNRFLLIWILKIWFYVVCLWLLWVYWLWRNRCILRFSLFFLCRFQKLIHFGAWTDINPFILIFWILKIWFYVVCLWLLWVDWLWRNRCILRFYLIFL